MIELRGTTWAHTRGFGPLAALGRVWEDFHPEERVTWTARSLWSFGEEPLGRLLDDNDLLVFDYPFAGEALEAGWVLPLEDLLDPATLEARREGTIGPLHDAFRHRGRQAALALDVATHAAAVRPDLMERLGAEVPADWDGVLSLARRGVVAMPMRPTGIWGAWLSLCANRGEPAFPSSGPAFHMDVAAAALADLAALARLVPDWCAEAYPVALLNRMACTEEIAYVPLTYAYSTYSLAGYAPCRIAFHPLPGGVGHGHGAILGGSGIGVSARSRHPDKAARHAAWLTSEAVQNGLYVTFAGQPASRAAWKDTRHAEPLLRFFQNLRDSAEHPYVRPNRPGFHDLQNTASRRLHRAVWHGEDPAVALREAAAAWDALPRRMEEAA
ncbi:extracellular solute-binding protein [Roseomonas sp. CCTCC AB2023176]|uniref:extracellular solute-binding protein n=1 Tax=Roseomonas sp. CCTCC AB2023176 TaxID=3342640 RepID=UPI0035DD3E39